MREWLLRAGASLYGAAIDLRRVAYRRGMLRRERVTRPVISVGNLAVGGVGKTPFVMLLVDRLNTRGLQVAVLTRGYGRRDERALVVVTEGVTAEVAGDEPILIARKTGADVVVCADRVRGANMAIARGADVLLLDDGFQHLRLQRDLDVVLLDRAQPFGALLPHGRLRERPAALERADLLVLVGEGEAPAGLPDLPTIAVSTRAISVERCGRREPPESLAGRSVALLSGIGRPARFARTVEQLGAKVSFHQALGDHQPIDDVTLEAFRRRAQAELMLTTEKDAARLGARRPADLAVLEIDFEVVDGDAQLERALDAVLA